MGRAFRHPRARRTRPGLRRPRRRPVCVRALALPPQRARWQLARAGRRAQADADRGDPVQGAHALPRGGACQGRSRGGHSQRSLRHRQRRVRYALKTPWRNGTTHVKFEPVELIAKLAALVPPPRAHLTRFHGIFAPNAALRAQLTSSGRGKDATTEASANADHRTPDEKRRSMTWAQRLKRVFGIDLDTCEHCGSAACWAKCPRMARMASELPSRAMRSRCRRSKGALRVEWPTGLVAGAGRAGSVGFPIFQRRLELTFNQSE